MIAGQGTIGLEILDQLPDVEAVVVPVGGGGLISGVSFAIKSLNPNVKVYGVQAEGAASMVQSLHDHKQAKLPSVATVADGIAVKEPGKITFETCSINQRLSESCSASSTSWVESRIALCCSCARRRSI